MELTTTQLKEVEIKHGSMTIMFTNRSFSKQTVIEPFNEINQYWETLPEETQAKIFDLYSEYCLLNLDMVGGVQGLSAIKSIVDRLNEYHQWAQIDEFRKTLKLGIPESVSKPDLRIYSQKTTYDQDSYEELQTLSLSLRPYFPLVAGASDICKTMFSVDLRDSQTYGVIRDTDGGKSEAVVRLRHYMESLPKFAKAKVPAGALIRGLGTEPRKEQLMHRVMLKKVLVSSLSSDDNMLSNIYKFADNVIKSEDRGDGKILDKKQKSSDSDDEKSVADLYKLPLRVNDGISVAINESMKNEELVLRALPEKIPVTLFRKFKSNLEKVMSRSSFVIHPYHPRLCSFFLGDLRWGCCPPRGFENLELDPMINAMAATQAMLWQWEYKELAVLMSAIVDDNIEVGMFGVGVSKGRTSQQLIDALHNLYPNSKTKPSVKARQMSEGITTIDEIAKLLASKNWKTKLPESLKDQVPEYLTTIPDLRANLGQILLKLDEAYAKRDEIGE